MRKFASRCTAPFVALILLFSSLTCFASEAAVDSPYAMLLDMKTGTVLYEKSSDTLIYPASTTKIMTALLALENLEIDKECTASKSAIDALPAGHTNMGILAGETLSVRQLLYGLMLASAGDAANVLAEEVSGSIPAFVELMNQKAALLDMSSTHYMNASGAHDEKHYTTVRDMAKLALWCMRIHEFREIVKTDLYVIAPTALYTQERRLINTNHLVSRLKTGQYYYNGANGIKTGFTNQAKMCLVSSAQRNSLELLSLVYGASTLDGKVMSFEDSRSLFDYGFANYAMASVVARGAAIAQAPIRSAKGTDKILLEAQSDVLWLTKTGDAVGEITHTDTISPKLKAPIVKGDVCGTSEYFVGGVSAGKVNLVADRDYLFDPVAHILQGIARVLTSPFFIVPIVLIVGCLIFLRQYNYRKRMRRRAAARRARAQAERDIQIKF